MSHSKNLNVIKKLNHLFREDSNRERKFSIDIEEIRFRSGGRKYRFINVLHEFPISNFPPSKLNFSLLLNLQNSSFLLFTDKNFHRKNFFLINKESSRY